MPELVVFDTNIWISGLLWRGKPYQCLLLARGKAIQHVHCTEMMADVHLDPLPEGPVLP